MMAGVGLGGPDPYRRPVKKPLVPPKKGIPKLPRPKPPTGLPGRPKPIPVKPPGTVTPTPTVPRPDFGAWYQTDPRYMLQSPQFQAQRAGLYGQYGLSPMIGADLKPVLDAKGHPRYNTASAADAPFSIVNQLAQAFAGQSQNIQDSANSRGLLFSGAQAQGQQNAATAADRQTSDAVAAFERALQGINTDESSLITSLYPDYLAQAPPAGPATPAPAAAAATASTSAAAKAAAEKDRLARIKKAQDHLRQDKIDAAKRKKLKGRPPKVTPKKSTIGSNANSLRGM